MNFLAHGFRHLDDPWFVAGTALPDWLRMLDRRARAPAEVVAPFADDADPRVASVACGVLRHHDDDRRFHGCQAFAAARGETTSALREILSSADGHRPSFVAHLVVEMHLDAVLAEESPDLLGRYYAALASLEPGEVEDVVGRVLPAAPRGVAPLVGRFVRERFLAEYADPHALARRLGFVLARARQPALPEGAVHVIARTRPAVASRRDELLGEAREPATAGSRYPRCRSLPKKDKR
jgi:hypothetical protein